MPEQCKGCKFWLKCEGEDYEWDYGFCRRYPPSPDDKFPVTDNDNWCGEFKPS